ncbi:MAG: transposase [Thermodesulfobacteriota bacterium]
MPRANRHFLPGHVWHVTHRCHKKEMLLKFAIDRSAWIQWLFEARKRYGLEVLNYAVTSNHIHLLVCGNDDRETIPRSLQLIAGRTAQAYNWRKNRNGAFWEDRYHATAVDTDDHLLRCMIYIDLNMVRARVVDHPAQWPHCGYHEIINSPRRYRILSRDRLKQLLGLNEAKLTDSYPCRVRESIQGGTERTEIWTRSIAVGRSDFVKKVKEDLGSNARHRELETIIPDGTSVLKESLSSYNADFKVENDGLSDKNAFFWKVFTEI